jgi:hypothetical protein
MKTKLLLCILGSVLLVAQPAKIVPAELKVKLLASERTAILAANGAQTALAEYREAETALYKAQMNAREARQAHNATVAAAEKELGCFLDDDYNCKPKGDK